MTDFLYRHPLNVQGKFYVDHTCTDCDFCCVSAPSNFARDAATAHSFLSKQPTNETELMEVLEAVEGCPTDSIGSDGDSYDWDDLPTRYEGWWSPCSEPRNANKATEDAAYDREG